MRGFRISARAIGQELALTGREGRGRVRQDDRVVAVRQALDEAVRAHELRRGADAAGLLVGDAERDVVEHRSGEELHVLRHAADLRPQLRRRHVGHVVAVDQHAARRTAETGYLDPDWRWSSCLAGTRGTDDAQDLAGGDLEVGGMQDRRRPPPPADRSRAPG